MKAFLSSVLLIICLNAFSQEKKQLEHSDFDLWNKISMPSISSNGQWICYELRPGFGDPTLKITSNEGIEILSYKRGNSAKISFDNQFIVFSIKPELDTLNKFRRQKIKDEDLPKDSLAIFNISKQNLIKYPRIKSFKVPEKWSSHMAFQVYTEKPKEQKNDTTKKDLKPKKSEKQKKENEKNGFKLVIYDVAKNKQDTIPFVKEYIFAEEGQKLMYYSTGNDSLFLQGVYLRDFVTNKTIPLCRGKGEYKNLSLNKTGTMATFLADRDTSKERIRPYEIFLWQQGKDSARVLLNNQSAFLHNNLLISENFKPYFSGNSNHLFFGIAEKPILQDTLLLPEEIVNVEVWNYKDKRLYTQQNAELKEEAKKSLLCVYSPLKNKFVQIADAIDDEIRFSHKNNADWLLILSSLTYMEKISWQGSPEHTDIYKFNIPNGKKTQIASNIRASNIHLSPEGKYIAWYHVVDSSWYVHQNQTGKTIKLTDSRKTSFADEENDVPNYPGSYGSAGWTRGDSLFIVYDRYDIWLMNPLGITKPERLTNGRENKTEYRYIPIYRDETGINPDKKQMAKSFDKISKQEGFYELKLKTKSLKKLLVDDFKFQTIVKSENSDNLILTRENFNEFPNLYCTDFSFSKLIRISDANPQQKLYKWGTAEPYKWNSLNGIELEGVLYKPVPFDPNKKYPMIVNFYEKSSDELHRHRTPEPHRSTVNYSFYTSRGYIIFTPDVAYRDGYPGESAYNSVMPGVTSLIEKGFVDPKRIGIQGHSWGAYQIAYILTKTNLFAAAEAGAPVPNMISAYGGIRWQTGLSRMFQYEDEQSRIGATLWEAPLKYIENSPIFFIDKINTPLLLMHNDNDGHVPWYQGIEWFVSMRRLGKPVWMLNYNGEPHWPLKWQNQKDFNIRMQQFFDHYLKGEPMPVWMEKGIPAKEKGITNGYEPSVN